MLNDESAPTALLASERKAISEPALCRLLRERLPFTDWFDVVRLSPSVFVDFDLRRLSYVYSEPCSLEAYLPAGWTGAYEDFFDRIPPEHRHWLREGVDYLAMALAAR